MNTSSIAGLHRGREARRGGEEEEEEGRYRDGAVSLQGDFCVTGSSLCEYV